MGKPKKERGGGREELEHKNKGRGERESEEIEMYSVDGEELEAG